MPQIDAKHPHYHKNVILWRRCRDCAEGEDAVKLSGILYLPHLSGQDEMEYESYKMRSHFYAASDRTVKGLAGAVLRKPPQIDVPEALKEYLDELGQDRENVHLLLKRTLEEVLTTGRFGLYVDAPEDGEGDCYVSLYYAENIINWREEMVDGRMKLTRVVLQEEYEEPDPEDDFNTLSKERYRVLLWDKEKELYLVQVWQREEIEHEGKTTVVQPSEARKSGSADEEEWVMISEVEPKAMGGKAWEEIPFLFVTPTTNTPFVEKPPILDLVNVNLSHYRNAADLEHGLHFTALPQAWVSGFNIKATELVIGSARAWVTQEPGGQAGYLEFSGAGLGSIRDRMKDKEQFMAILGARLLEEQKSDAEAAETVRLRHSGEDSVLSHLTKSVSQAFTKVLSWVATWHGYSDAEVSVELNGDFNVTGIDPKLLMQLMAAVQAGLISWETWAYNLKRGEILADNVTEDEEKQRIEAGAPMTPPAAADQALKESTIPNPKDQKAQTQLDQKQSAATIQLTKAQAKAAAAKAKFPKRK